MVNWKFRDVVTCCLHIQKTVSGQGSREVSLAWCGSCYIVSTYLKATHCILIIHADFVCVLLPK